MLFLLCALILAALWPQSRINGCVTSIVGSEGPYKWTFQIELPRKKNVDSFLKALFGSFKEVFGSSRTMVHFPHFLLITYILPFVIKPLLRRVLRIFVGCPNGNGQRLLGPVQYKGTQRQWGPIGTNI